MDDLCQWFELEPRSIKPVFLFILTAVAVTTYVFFIKWLKKTTNIVRYKADHRLRPKKLGSKLPPIYPNGWIPVAESRLVNDQQPTEALVCGNQVVLFRKTDFSLVCLDAFCPHLGANLAHGGRIEKHENENCIRCPFHGWKFNSEGVCVDVPYTKGSVPKGVRVRQWKCQEANGFVFVWYHADNEEPSWNLISIEKIDSGVWKYMGRTEHTVGCHFQEIPENGADVGHLNVIHSESSIVKDPFVYRPKWLYKLLQIINHHTWEAVWDPPEMQTAEKLKHVNNISLKTEMNFFGYTVFRMSLLIQQIGPATVNLLFNANFRGVWKMNGAFVQGLEPMEPFKHRIVHLLFCEDKWINRFLAKFMLEGEASMVERDIAMWNRKRFLRNPQLVKEEKSILQFRSWFQQFYSESSPTLQTLRDSLEW